MTHPKSTDLLPVTQADIRSGEEALEWRWWAGSNEEEYCIAGPCKSREEAISIAYGSTEPGDTIYLIEAVAGEWNDFEGLFMFTHQRNESSVICEEDPE